jgi:TolA-binding protein
MTCSWADRDEVFEAYVRDALGADERDAFEEHYFACAACFDKLRTYRALRAELGAAVTADVQAPTVADARPWRWVLVPAGVGVALLATVSLWRGDMVLRVPEPRPAVVPGDQTSQPSVGPAVVAPQAPPAAPASVPSTRPAPPPVVALSVLAQVTPPAYIPVVLRGPRDEAVERFEVAMTRYVEGDYAGTIAGLRAAAEIDRSSAQISFFLAACELLTDQLEPAAAGFERTIALGESPYLEEAHFYLAKARLRQGRVPAAREQLRQTAARRGRLEQEARRLLAQLAASSTGKQRPDRDEFQ